MVLSQLKMPNLNYWGPGESIDTHIVWVGNKKDKVTSACKGPRVLGVPGQLKISHFDFRGLEKSNGTHILGFCEKMNVTFFARFLDLVIFALM